MTDISLLITAVKERQKILLCKDEYGHYLFSHSTCKSLEIHLFAQNISGFNKATNWLNIHINKKGSKNMSQLKAHTHITAIKKMALKVQILCCYISHKYFYMFK